MTDKLVILIVDDNRTNLMLMVRLVDQIHGCIALPFASALEVFEQVHNIDYDLAIVDYQMARMNGLDLIEVLRADKAKADKPIVMVTADNQSEVWMAALKAGVMEFLHKPIEPVELTTKIHDLSVMCNAQHKLADRAAWLHTEVQAATDPAARGGDHSPAVPGRWLQGLGAPRATCACEGVRGDRRQTRLLSGRVPRHRTRGSNA